MRNVLKKLAKHQRTVMYDAVSAPAVLVLVGWPAAIVVLGIISLSATIYMLVKARNADLRRHEESNMNKPTGDDTL